MKFIHQTQGSMSLRSDDLLEKVIMKTKTVLLKLPTDM